MTTLHRLGVMPEPSPLDIQHTIITAAHMAREVLSLAERIADAKSNRFAEAQRHITSALVYLHAVEDLLSNWPDGPLLVAIARSLAASEAALGHAKLAASYALPQDDFETQKRERTYSIWFRATEAARQEVHRLLAALVERFPGACDVALDADEEKRA